MHSKAGGVCPSARTIKVLKSTTTTFEEADTVPLVTNIGNSDAIVASSLLMMHKLHDDRASLPVKKNSSVEQSQEPC